MVLLIVLVLIAVLALIGNLLILMQVRDRLDALVGPLRPGVPARYPPGDEARPPA